MKEPGVVSPAGYNVTPRDEVVKRRAELRAEITAAELATKPRS